MCLGVGDKYAIEAQKDQKRADISTKIKVLSLCCVKLNTAVVDSHRCSVLL